MQIGSIELGDRPVLLAPMEDVSDSPFRLICRQKGASAVYTEFISSEGLVRDQDRTICKMDFRVGERPFGIQIFGSRDEAMDGATRMAAEQKPDLIDINFGCPVYKIAKKGAGAGCLKDLSLMEEMAGAVVDAAGDIPVTVKTRLAWDRSTIRIREVGRMLQSVGVQAIAVHARTRNQKYKGDARWDYLKHLKETPGLEIPVIGNGDVTTPEKAKQMFDETGVDAVMIGRGAIGNPWIFEQTHHYLEHGEYLPEPSVEERINLCMEQLRMSVRHHGEKYGVIMMKKHYGQYLKGLHKANQLRGQIMKEKTMPPIIELLETYKKERMLAAAS